MAKFILILFCLTCGLFAQISQENILANSDFSETRDGLAVGWEPQRGWSGKSEYSLEEGALVIRRVDDPKGAGAYATPKTPLKGASFVQVGGDVSGKGLSGAARIMVQFFDAQGKSDMNIPVGQVSQKSDWVHFNRILQVPPQTEAIRVFLIINGQGEAYFRNPFVSTNPLPEPNNLENAPYILNGSFEGADFNEGFVDCYQVRTGVAKRVARAFHGCHALQLEPGTQIIYGTADGIPIAVEAGMELELSFMALGESGAQAQVEFVNDEGTTLSTDYCSVLSVDDVWRQGVKQIVVPENATGARLMLANTGDKAVILDALHLGASSFSADECLVVPVSDVLRDEETADTYLPSEVRDHNGVPTWYIDGKPMLGAMFTLSNAVPGVAKSWYGYERRAMKSGQFPVVLISASISSHPGNTRHPMEQALADIDFQVGMCLAEVPDAQFIIWLFLEGCQEFVEEYPQDIIVNEQPELPWRDDVAPYSFGAEAWGRLCARQVGELLKEVAKKSYAKHIVGVSPGMGRYGENNWGHAEVKGGYTPNDFCPAMQNFFRNWLFQEYGGDVRAFAKAWNRQGRFNFTNAFVPGSQLRLTRSLGAYFDPKTERQTLDYLRCESFSILHRVLQQCEAVKKATDGKLFTFIQAGYFTSWIYHREFAPVLNNPYLDAVGPAPPYINRGPGDDVLDHGPAASVQAHGKVWLFQADIRSHLADDHNWRYGRTKNEDESVGVFLRDMGHYMTTGTYPYYMSFEPWYDCPKMWDVISRFQENLNLAAQFPQRSASEIAVVVDTDSICLDFEYNYVTRLMPIYQSSLEYNRTFEWQHLGAPYDFFMLDDLLTCKDLERYKVVVFAVNSVVSDSQRKLIGEKLRKDGRTLVWIHGAGLVNKHGLNMDYNLQNASDLMGFKLVQDDKRDDLSIKLKDGRVFGRFTTDIYGGFTTPDKPVKVRHENFHPSFNVVPEEDVEVFGTYENDGAPAAAIRRRDGWTDVFWGSTALNKEVLLPILDQANVHAYTDVPAVVYANENFLVVHTPVAGKRRILLPRKAQCVYDLYARREIAHDTARVEVDMAENSSLLLYFGERQALADALKAVSEELTARASANEARKPEFAHQLTRKAPLGKPVASDGVYRPDGDGFIRHWLFLAPLPNYGPNSLNTDYLSGENKAAPQAGDGMDVVFDASTSDRHKVSRSWFDGEMKKATRHIQWKPVQFSQGNVEKLYDEFSLEDLPYSDDIIYYLACKVISPEERRVVISVGSDDTEKCWLNGELVTEFNGPGRACVPESETAQVKLKPGKNTLLLKISQGGGGVGHALRFLDSDTNLPITNLQISLE